MAYEKNFFADVLGVLFHRNLRIISCENNSPLLEFYRRLYYDNSRISCYNGCENGRRQRTVVPTIQGGKSCDI